MLEVEGCRTTFGDDQDCPGFLLVRMGGMESKTGRRLSFHISLYNGNRTHFAITWVAEVCCFFLLRVLNKNFKLGTEGGRDGVGIHKGLGTERHSKSEGHRQDCTVEKGNDRGSSNLRGSLEQLVVCLGLPCWECRAVARERPWL